MKKRMVSQDIAKGIAILLVVQTHTLQLTRPVGTVLGVLFGYAMPFFLFISGYNYRPNARTPWENIRRRTWQILKPFLIYSLSLFVIMGIYFLVRHEATVPELFKSFAAFLMSKWGARLIGWNLPQVLFQRILGPYWFLQFLVTANIFFYLFVDRALSSTARLISTLVLLSGISVFLIEMKVVLPWGLQNAPAIAGVMILAAWMHQKDCLFSEPSAKYWKWINAFVALLTIGLTQLFHSGAGYVGAGALGEVCGGAEVYIMYVMAVCGSYLIITISGLIEKCRFLTRILTWLGTHTLQILMLHLAVMHVLKDIFGLPQTNAADSLFVDHVEPMNVVVYFATIFVCVGIILLIEKIRASLSERKKSVPAQ